MDIEDAHSDHSTILFVCYVSGGSLDSIVARPDLYDLLLRQIPKENIHMGKRVLSTLQNENGVVIRCSDDSSYDGDILVSADGAYSAVRQHYTLSSSREKGSLVRTTCLCSLAAFVSSAKPRFLIQKSFWIWSCLSARPQPSVAWVTATRFVHINNNTTMV